MGLIGKLTVAARELVCLAGSGCGFESAAWRLNKFCGWTVSEQTMRRTCEAEGARVEKWRQDHIEPASPTTSTSPEEPVPAIEAPVPVNETSEQSSSTAETPSIPGPRAAVAFRQAKGAVEFMTDGTSLNTLNGWRELRLALWLKRPPSTPAQPQEWCTRILPKPTARSVLIDLADSELFGARWRPWSATLGITDPASMDVLADGAEWIWNQAQKQFPGATGSLDVFHATEHLADTAAAIYGADSGAARAWGDVATNWMIREGWNGVCRWVAAVRQDRGNDASTVAETELLLGYFAKHTAHLNYAKRLAEGRSIGSGPIEGANKQLIGRRLKQTGARWLERNAIAVGTLCSCEYVDDWDAYWQNSYPSIAI